MVCFRNTRKCLEAMPTQTFKTLEDVYRRQKLKYFQGSSLSDSGIIPLWRGGMLKWQTRRARHRRVWVFPNRYQIKSYLNVYVSISPCLFQEWWINSAGGQGVLVLCFYYPWIIQLANTEIIFLKKTLSVKSNCDISVCLFICFESGSHAAQAKLGIPV